MPVSPDAQANPEDQLADQGEKGIKMQLSLNPPVNYVVRKCAGINRSGTH
jgi:hypothetical protein